MPNSRRKRPTEITIKVYCCRHGCTLTTRGDWKNKVCWSCNSIIHFERYPEILLVINDNNITDNRDKWHIVNEEEVDEEE
jgi:hypothetical protein